MISNFFLILATLLSPSIVQADTLISVSEAPCENREISLDKDQLRCLRSLDVVQAIRKNFGDLLVLKKTCPECKTLMVNEDEFRSFYHLPFLVVSAAFATMGSGVDVFIVFKERPTQVFELLVEYLPDQGIYQLRVMDIAEPSRKVAALIKKLKEKEFAEFWIERL